LAATTDEQNDALTGEQGKSLPVEKPYFELGLPVRDVEINVDLAIVKHFSEHLYSSPNKAIEELVSNSFDALATKCFVYVPGELAGDRVVVWDNGLSMDVDGITAMWQIAKSPKEALGGDRVVHSGSRQRAVIGKFGIGKLASYAVGHRISHICRTPDGRHLAVSVDYRRFTDTPGPGVTAHTDNGVSGSKALLDGTTARPQSPPEGQDQNVTGPGRILAPQTSIRELTEQQAGEAARAVLPTGGALDIMLREPHWTLAIIDDLRSNKTLYPGRLSWILGNGMPLRPDFKVWVEDEEVRPRLASNASTIWDLSEPELRDALSSAWADARSQGNVSGDIDLDPPAPVSGTYEAEEPNALEPAVLFPNLGRVTATVRLFEDSLASHENDGRSHGFFLMVRGRLVNPDDDKLLLHDPSFGTFYRSQYVLVANGLDAELLADRESLRRETAMTRELNVLQVALYRVARVAISRSDTVKDKATKPESRLPVRSRELFRDPMAALFSRAVTKPTSINLDEPIIDRKSLGESSVLSQLEESTGHLQVNSSHPFYSVVESQAGSGKRGAAVMRAFDLFAVSERLTEGFLYGRGMPEDQVMDILQWRDKLFRSLAQGYSRNTDDAILELRAASVAGDKRFENAIAEVFKLMGFSATRDGASGEKDVVVIAPVGPNHRIFIVEAKGSSGPVQNVPAAVASAASHRDKVPGATHALIVARDFAGFERKDEPAILEECRAVKGVSVVTVEAIADLYESLLKYSYPLETIMDALFVLESPDAKRVRVADLEKPLHRFNFGHVLEDIWEGQSGHAVRDLVSIRFLWQSRPEWRDEMGVADFTSKLTALSHFAGHLMVLDTLQHTVHITQHPEFVAAHVERALRPPLIDFMSAEGAATIVE
jgi:hypothetical protein